MSRDSCGDGPVHCPAAGALTGKSRAKDVPSVVGGLLYEVTPYVTRMKEISTSIGHEFHIYAQDFTNTFPEYRPKARVIFTISLFNFDGGTRPVCGKTALLFGIDGIARYHQPGESLKVFFDHDLFHQYHD